MQDYLKVVVTGEVDSGKSTLIGRFLYELGSLSQGVIEEIGEVCQRLGSDFEFAYLLDSFEEERKNQLTIDTTQVFCKTKRGKSFVFIDVPGHKELLKNMISGSSYADIAVLVVDVQKSIEEQTRRHAFILKFLGVEQIILALNKMDAADFEENTFKKVREDTREFFRKVGIEPKYFIPISAKQGENISKRSKKMPWYEGFSLQEALNTRLKKEINKNFRLPIQDVYNLNGEKLSVGKIISGRIKIGEKVKILPLDKECIVKTIKIFNKNRSAAEAPQSIGLRFDDMDGLKRGQIICKPEMPLVGKEIMAKLFCVHSFNIKESLRFKCATQETIAWISKIMGTWDTISLAPRPKKDLLNETDIAEAVITTENPVVVDKYKAFNSLGRFILKSNEEIYAVGTIL